VNKTHREDVNSPRKWIKHSDNRILIMGMCMASEKWKRNTPRESLNNLREE
jgi:hypothetical protein